MTRDELLAMLSKPPIAEPIEQGWYVNGDHGEPDNGANFCHPHAEIVARWYALESGIVTWADSGGGERDSAARCEFGGCGIALDFNGLTDDGVDNALGLTEPSPLQCHVYPAELELAARSMMKDDPRWETWEAHARALIAKRKEAA